MYHVPCLCGNEIAVELFQAGTTNQCPHCRTTVTIPGSTKLKELSGDPYPHLSPIDKLLKTLAEHRAPFGGTCHHCGNCQAAFQVPIELNIVVERHLDDTHPIQPHLSGIKLTVAGGGVLRRLVRFPLLLCPSCSNELKSAISQESMTRWITRISVTSLVIAVLIFLSRRPEILALIGRMFWVIWAIVAVVAIRLTAKRTNVNNVIGRWVREIRWASEALEGEDEYTLSAGQIEPYEAPAFN